MTSFPFKAPCIISNMYHTCILPVPYLTCIIFYLYQLLPTSFLSCIISYLHALLPVLYLTYIISYLYHLLPTSSLTCIIFTCIISYLYHIFNQRCNKHVIQLHVFIFKNILEHRSRKRKLKSNKASEKPSQGFFS